MTSFDLKLISFLLGLIGTFLVSKIWEKYLKVGFDSNKKVQTIHTQTSLRVGGIINIFFIINVTLLLKIFDIFPIFFLFFLPMIFIMILEDLFQSMSIIIRFLFIIFTSFSLVYYSNSPLEIYGLFFLEYFFSNFILATIVTSIGIIVTCNAWNFVDGLNGISSGLGASTLLIFTILSQDIYIDGFREFLILTSFIFFGFCLLNLLTGKVFLGDTGSYFLGTLIGWSGVLLVNSNSNISPWAVFLIIIYPASDITFSVIRRIYYKKSPFKSDKLHLHSLLYLYLNLSLNLKPKITNTISGSLIILLGILPGMYCLKINALYPNVFYASFIYFFLYTILYIYLKKMLKIASKI